MPLIKGSAANEGLNSLSLSNRSTNGSGEKRIIDAIKEESKETRDVLVAAFTAEGTLTREMIGGLRQDVQELTKTLKVIHNIN